MEEVSFNQDAIVKIDNNIISELKTRAAKNESGKYRFCLQHSPKDLLHEMFIVRRKGDYGRPDKHLHTTESHMIIDGAMLVVLFEDDGQIREVFKLSKECFHTYRIDTNIYHMQIPLSEQVVYYEIKSGPFTEDTNIFPKWAPEANDKKKVAAFMKELEEEIDKFNKSSIK